ncbi:homogentisate 1,2-dioxygenase [Paraglaciecola chathamensis]|jgi:homogentisate 1,2-dioxygenase|uniref:Homogentisate 1,2-dioxygenase n=1 Tax=Paraglaciecola agarilytica NO2 TaxID=1125747 RepID=A0ABQ0IBU9_9ALTE|nr:homogentisate 1,2-dioxygenase [Paraglaciecola agarilytica]GAC06878.1 homogentisate 1,2-dioxygenase [Paraglaciecola agarilytica NO2]
MIRPDELQYLNGFGNEFETEAKEGALPIGQFNPQKVAFGLYAEQFSTTAFTMARDKNRRTWFYRIRPSAAQSDYRPFPQGLMRSGPITEVPSPPNLLRWDPLPMPEEPTDFVSSLVTLAANGSVGVQGVGVHVYAANQSMQNRYFYNADGELLIVPQQGALLLHTESGILHIAPGEICVIPRGIKFRVDLPDGTARGYIAENYGAPMILPERGPVGSNGFANERDFQAPVAAYEDIDGDFELVCKFNGGMFVCDLDHSPLDVVAWVGTSYPYKYDLSRFNTMNTVSFDHPDPSIFTVLTSQTDTEGTANLDFVIFPPRWMVAENTFRPPWYHRNLMSEFMGLIEGVYDAKEHGFMPGGASLHNCMTPHGPEAVVFEQASNADLKPQRYEDTMAFMFESRFIFEPTEFALQSTTRQREYHACYSNLKNYFREQK